MRARDIPLTPRGWFKAYGGSIPVESFIYVSLHPLSPHIQRKAHRIGTDAIASRVIRVRLR